MNTVQYRFTKQGKLVYDARATEAPRYRVDVVTVNEKPKFCFYCANAEVVQAAMEKWIRLGEKYMTASQV